MRLGLKEGWAGRKRKTAVCPSCSSDRARYSRRHYDGPWFLAFRVRPVKCSDCGSYFPIAADASIRRPETDSIDLHIPFRPSELDGPQDGGAGTFPAGACPICGSDQVRPSRPGTDQPLARRLDVRTPYRCARCNGSFRRANPLRLLVLSLLLVGVLAGLSYLGIAVLSWRGRIGNSPHIRKDQIKEPPPPVFR
jgi:transposase-like protein